MSHRVSSSLSSKTVKEDIIPERNEKEYIEYVNHIINKHNENIIYMEDYTNLLTERPTGSFFVRFDGADDDGFGGVFESFVYATSSMKYLVRVGYPGVDHFGIYQQDLYVKAKHTTQIRKYKDIKRVGSMKIRFLDSKDKRYHLYYIYRHVEFKKDENDCLGFAEKMQVGRFIEGDCILKPRDIDVYSLREEPKYMEERFELKDEEGDYIVEDFDKSCEGYIGNTDQHNVRIAMLSRKYIPGKINEYAEPNIGEAYGIIYTNFRKDMKSKKKVTQTPYHIASVVDVDDGFIVTIEADASDKDRVHPLFEIYSSFTRTGDVTDKRLFHNVHKQTYGSDTAVTIVLKPDEDKLKILCPVSVAKRPKALNVKPKTVAVRRSTRKRTLSVGKQRKTLKHKINEREK